MNHFGADLPYQYAVTEICGGTIALSVSRKRVTELQNPGIPLPMRSNLTSTLLTREPNMVKNIFIHLA